MPWDSAWDDLGTDERAAIKARQGVAMPFMEDVAVWDQRANKFPVTAQRRAKSSCAAMAR